MERVHHKEWLTRNQMRGRRNSILRTVERFTKRSWTNLQRMSQKLVKQHSALVLKGVAAKDRLLSFLSMPPWQKIIDIISASADALGAQDELRKGNLEYDDRTVRSPL